MNQLIVLHPYYAYHTIKEMHTIVLIDVLWFNVVCYSSLFQFLDLATMVPTLVENR